MKKKVLPLIFSGLLAFNFSFLVSCSDSSPRSFKKYDLSKYNFQEKINMIETKNCKDVTDKEILNVVFPTIKLDLESKSNSGYLDNKDFKITLYGDDFVSYKSFDLSEMFNKIYIKVYANQSSKFLENKSDYIKIKLQKEAPYDLSKMSELTLKDTKIVSKKSLVDPEYVRKLISLMIYSSFADSVRFVDPSTIKDDPFYISLFTIRYTHDEDPDKDHKPFFVPILTQQIDFLIEEKIFFVVQANVNCTFLVGQTEKADDPNDSEILYVEPEINPDPK